MNSMNVTIVCYIYADVRTTNQQHWKSEGWPGYTAELRACNEGMFSLHMPKKPLVTKNY